MSVVIIPSLSLLVCKRALDWSFPQWCPCYHEGPETKRQRRTCSSDAWASCPQSVVKHTGLRWQLCDLGFESSWWVVGHRAEVSAVLFSDVRATWGLVFISALESNAHTGFRELSLNASHEEMLDLICDYLCLDLKGAFPESTVYTTIPDLVGVV